MEEPAVPLGPSQTGETSPVTLLAQPQPLSETTDTPPSFTQKRRGRPPGRPNTTVKESDYENNTHVQRWNAAKIEKAIPAVAINIRDALPESFLTRAPQRAIFKHPSRELIYFVQGWITSRQISSQRPSYVNGLLIHSRGEDSPTSCDQCAEKRAKNALGPFLTCRVLNFGIAQGSFHNSCSNCKWFDTTSACSLYTGPKPNRKRKAKGTRDEEVMIGDGVQDVTGNDGTFVPPTVHESAYDRADPTATHVMADGTDAAVLSLHQHNGDLPVAEDEGAEIPADFDHEA